MNKLVNLTLATVAMFLTACRTDNVQEYNITYKFSDQDPMATEAPHVDGPNTIKTNEEKLITLTYDDLTAPSEVLFAVSEYQNISIKDDSYIKVNDYTATFIICNVQGDCFITFFKYQPQPPIVF